MEPNCSSSEPTEPTPFACGALGYGGGEQKMEIDFISQFLELPINQSSLHHQPTSNPTTNKSTSKASTQTILDLGSNHQNPIQHHRNNSIFHNFQKHIVRTLKNNVKLKIAHKGIPALKLAYKMWQIFIQSNLFSKKILHFLFGENYLQIRNYGITKAEPLLLAHSVEQLSAAQCFLRQEIIRQGHRLLQQKGFSGRRMQNSEAFESYFLTFLEELQAGPLNRRLPKTEKLLILEQSKVMREEI